MGFILLRYGELALKGANRNEFVRRLRRNVRACLKANHLQGQVVSEGQRIYVHTDQVEEALEPLSRVFGLVSLSPAIEVPRDIDAIVEEVVHQAQNAGLDASRSFRVRARRADKTFPLTSPEISRLAGEAVNRATGGRVDLSNNADLTIGVEVAREAAIVFGRVAPAPGGLPLGIEGRVVVLLSGGIDSPVAAWLMMKRGCGIIPVHFTANAEETQKALDNVQVLNRYAYGWDIKPVIIDHEATVGATLEGLRQLGEERWSCVFCKRALLLKAAEIAEEMGAGALVMGDALGQVASQTLSNMEMVSHGVPKMILRPLIGMDKVEIIKIAERIGTFAVSTRSEASCRFLPAHPATHGTIEKLRAITAQLDAMAPAQGSVDLEGSEAELGG
ncbi:MAG: tRNA uracil 4-sulfurtransferase ThiI [Anaerolineae bacterium]